MTVAVGQVTQDASRDVRLLAMRDDGRLGMRVRADATNAERIRGKFVTPAAP